MQRLLAAEAAGETPASLARSIRRAARETVARLAGRSPEAIVFTSGPAEAANFAIRGLFGPDRPRTDGHCRAIVSAIEASFIHDSLRRLAGGGIETTVLPVDECGHVRPADLFWWGLLWWIVAWGLFWVLTIITLGIGVIFAWIFPAIVFVWYLYRVIVGWLKLGDGKPIG